MEIIGIISSQLPLWKVDSTFGCQLFPTQHNLQNEVKIMNTELYNENFEVLHKKFYPKWIAQVRSKIPADYNISDNEIVSEITDRCLELAEKFKGGFFPSYCDLYVVCEVVKRMWNEYKKIDHSVIADAYDEFENGEDYTETPVVVAIDPSYTYVDDRKCKIRQLTSVYESAIRLDT